ncbi:MAG: tetratricopeptide repeat protein [Deltaproteobacteria bacterium]|nr:tetratricopeptide repeat protein [Deltaproteobacteria bacterium]
MAHRYSTRDVARLVKLPESRVRSLVRAGVVSGGRAVQRGNRLSFDFGDMVVLRAAQALSEAGLRPAKVLKALVSLRKHLPGERPLSAVRISIDGGVVVVSDGRVHWEPESGQARLSLTLPARERVASVVHAKRRKAEHDAPVSADECFTRALALEDDDPDGAYESYLAALAQDPEHLEAMINIGRLCSEAGDTPRAAAYFRQAIRVNPTHPVAHFNLAVTLHDVGRLSEAETAYRAALARDPHFADAHFNLAALLDETGAHDEAAAHRARYQAIVGEVS